jgi:phosphohistidine phosphatase SixA
VIFFIKIIFILPTEMASQQYIHLFRHGLAKHNVSGDFYMHDPLLTPCGIESAKETLEQEENCFKKPTLVLISPLQRCIQTALYAFHPEWNKKAAEFFGDSPPRFVAMPQL